MSIRINFEIGHEAAIRSKRTIDGFTHDWEVFVRGCENADIHYFIDKVVFHLHETFPNPKRVIKDPPYRVRESGYAGFNLPIDIYLRNNEEPKKIRFNYDINLQTTGPAIYKVQKEKYVFCNPTEEFRHKLMKGGGVVSIPSSNDNSRDVSTSNDKQHLANKAKSIIGSVDTMKKHRKEHKAEDSFTDLFGTPITKSLKVSPDTKLQLKTSPTSNPIIKPEKSSNPKKSKNKHSPKEKDRDKDKKDKSQDKKHKEEKKNKERIKDKERKDKTIKRDKSPKLQNLASPIRSPKRPGSPKRIPSPKRPPSPLIKMKSDEKKIEEVPLAAPPIKEKIKMEFKKSKYEIKDKEKEKKEHKSHKEKEPAMRALEPKEHKGTIKEPKPIKEPIVVNKIKEKIMKPPEEPPLREPEKVIEKPKIDKAEPDKSKHKHKKKDNKEKREKKEDKSKEKKEEKKKSEKEKPETFFEKVYKDQAKVSPKETEKNSIDSKTTEIIGERSGSKEKSRGLDALQAELQQQDESTDSSITTHDESSVEIPTKPVVVEKLEKKKDKVKLDQNSEKKRKRKHESTAKQSVNIKVEEPEPKISREEPESVPKPKEMKNNGTEEGIPQDYMSILKELQHKIMTLQDNNELQRVVQLIAETGHYEITAQTFDFDLCALDRDTVRRLQEFFAMS